MTPAHEQELELLEIISDLQQKNLDLQREKTKLLADREIANSIIVSLTNLLNASREGTESLVCFKRLRN